eukprot:scaffold262615_cov27-Tisochrysis_lutea.AAC.2
MHHRGVHTASHHALDASPTRGAHGDLGHLNPYGRQHVVELLVVGLEIHLAPTLQPSRQLAAAG